VNHRSDSSTAGARYLKPLAISLSLVLAFTLVEIVAGFLSGSLALISDAGHMATDSLGLGMAVAAIVTASRISTAQGHTYGQYRLEILAALANSVLLMGVSGYVIFEAIQRLQTPPDVSTGPMLVVAILGLIVNLVAWALLRRGARKSINVRGAYLEVMADTAGSIGVVVAALIMITTGWPYADPIFAGLIGLFILPRAFRLGRTAVRILVQAAPENLDIETVERDLLALEGVLDVHDLHIWTLTSEMDVASAHLIAQDRADPHGVLDEARSLLQDDYGIEHATVQVEPEDHRECSEVSW
jgi:cobalt-zinc-cadmium efflux system protein